MPFFAVSPIQYIEGSHRAAGSSPAASLLPEKIKEKIVIVSSFSTEPKSRYAAQSDYFTVKAEPSRLREKIRPEGKDGCSCLRKAVVKTAPVGRVSRYNKQGLCVPKTQSEAAR